MLHEVLSGRAKGAPKRSASRDWPEEGQESRSGSTKDPLKTLIKGPAVKPAAPKPPTRSFLPLHLHHESHVIPPDLFSVS